MRRVQGSKSIVCSKKELQMMEEVCYGLYSCCGIYELPLFSLNPQSKTISQVKTDYVLVRPCRSKLTQTFFDRINKTWNKMYD